MTDSCACGADRDRRKLLAFLGAAMIATGQPIDEIEDELREVGRHLGAPDLQVGRRADRRARRAGHRGAGHLRVRRGRLRLDQAADVRLIRHLLVSGQIDLEQALERLLGCAASRPATPWLAELGFMAWPPGSA